MMQHQFTRQSVPLQQQKAPLVAISSFLGGAATTAAAVGGGLLLNKALSNKTSSTSTPTTTTTATEPVSFTNQTSIDASLEQKRAQLRRTSFNNTIYAGAIQNPYGNGSNKLGG